jgi:hypothetical protein
MHVSVMLSVCICCGHIKTSPPARCAVCRFQPQSPQDKAKSFILSTAYEADGEYRGRTKEQLIAIAAAIEKGQLHAFDETEVMSVISYAENVLGAPDKRLVVDGLQWLLPPLLVLSVAYLVIFWVE